jgi:hypothetical protein
MIISKKRLKFAFFSILTILIIIQFASAETTFTEGNFFISGFSEGACTEDANCTSACPTDYIIEIEQCTANHTCGNNLTTGVLEGTVCDSGSSVNPDADNYCDIIQDCVEFNTSALGYFRGYTDDQIGNCVDINRQESPESNFNVSQPVLIIGDTEEVIFVPDGQTCSEGYDTRSPATASVILVDSGTKFFVGFGYVAVFIGMLLASALIVFIIRKIRKI